MSLWLSHQRWDVGREVVGKQHQRVSSRVQRMHHFFFLLCRKAFPSSKIKGNLYGNIINNL